jgi:hypothetical protein
MNAISIIAFCYGIDSGELNGLGKGEDPAELQLQAVDG